MVVGPFFVSISSFVSKISHQRIYEQMYFHTLHTAPDTSVRTRIETAPVLISLRLCRARLATRPYARLHLHRRYILRALLSRDTRVDFSASCLPRARFFDTLQSTGVPRRTPAHLRRAYSISNRLISYLRRRKMTAIPHLETLLPCEMQIHLLVDLSGKSDASSWSSQNLPFPGGQHSNPVDD